MVIAPGNIERGLLYDALKTLVVDRDHVRGGLRRDSAHRGYDARVSVIDTGWYVHVDLNQSRGDDSREIDGGGLSADCHRHGVGERAGSRKNLSSRNGGICGAESSAP